MANLLLDIGNTNAKAAYGNGGMFGEIFRDSHNDVCKFVHEITEERHFEVIVLSTVREKDVQLESFLKEKCNRLITIDPSIELPMGFGIGFPSKTLGADRLAAALAVAMMFPDKDCIKFDFGTALTVDFISGKGIFEGGNISLGMQSRFRALNEFTGRLPYIKPGGETVDYGTDTVQAMTSGVILGMIFEVEGYLKKYPGRTVVFTGGDSFYFAEKLKRPIFVIPNLVMAGLALIADYYAQQKI